MSGRLRLPPRLQRGALRRVADRLTTAENEVVEEPAILLAVRRGNNNNTFYMLWSRRLGRVYCPAAICPNVTPGKWLVVSARHCGYREVSAKWVCTRAWLTAPRLEFASKDWESRCFEVKGVCGLVTWVSGDKGALWCQELGAVLVEPQTHGRQRLQLFSTVKFAAVENRRENEEFRMEDFGWTATLLEAWDEDEEYSFDAVKIGTARWPDAQREVTTRRSAVFARVPGYLNDGFETQLELGDGDMKILFTEAHLHQGLTLIVLHFGSQQLPANLQEFLTPQTTPISTPEADDSSSFSQLLPVKLPLVIESSVNNKSAEENWGKLANCFGVGAALQQSPPIDGNRLTNEWPLPDTPESSEFEFNEESYMSYDSFWDQLENETDGETDSAEKAFEYEQRVSLVVKRRLIGRVRRASEGDRIDWRMYGDEVGNDEKILELRHKQWTCRAMQLRAGQSAIVNDNGSQTESGGVLERLASVLPQSCPSKEIVKPDSCERMTRNEITTQSGECGEAEMVAQMCHDDAWYTTNISTNWETLKLFVDLVDC